MAKVPVMMPQGASLPVRMNTIFLHITEHCQLRCRHCYLGERHLGPKTMSSDMALSILETCRANGATAVTFVGGEPTLHPSLASLVTAAERLGYTAIDIDTNGLLAEPLLRLRPPSLRYIKISLDGPSAELHELVRGRGTFEIAHQTILRLVDARFPVAITCTLFSMNLRQIEEMFQLSESAGVNALNFHALSEQGSGAAMRDWFLDPLEWIEACELIGRRARLSPLIVWYPPSWIHRQYLSRYQVLGFRGCTGKSMDRLAIFPDGSCYACSMLLDRVSPSYKFASDGLHLLTNQDGERSLFSAIGNQSCPQTFDCPAEMILRENEPSLPADVMPLCRLWKYVAIDQN